MVAPVRARLIRTLRNAGSPQRTAAAFALGVFLGFSPFLGFQMAIGFSTACALRLSRIVMFAGLNVNLPWLMIPWYTLATFAGAFILQAQVAVELGPALEQLFSLPLTGPAFWTRSMEIAAPFFWSFIFGSTTGALLISAISYVAVLRILTRAGIANVTETPAETMPCSLDEASEPGLPPRQVEHVHLGAPP